MTTPVSENFLIELPVVGGSDDIWGGLLNAMIGTQILGTPSGTSFDVELKRVDDVAAANTIVADAALARSGGAMTGRTDEFSATLQKVDLGAASGAVPMDLALANFFQVAPAGATTFSFSNVPTVATATVIAFLSIFQGGTQVISWDPIINFPGGAATLPLSGLGRDLIGFYTLDDGVSWNGALAQSDVR